MTEPRLPTRRDLARAFREIEASTGLLMREDCACCQSCACSHLDKEATEAGRPSRYAFWHAQDTEAAAATDVLYIGYTGTSDEDTTAIGHVLREALASRGYFVRWDGSPDTRLAVAVRGASFDPFEVPPVFAETDPEEMLLADGWTVLLWEEPEAALANNRWRALIVAPYGTGEHLCLSESRLATLAAAREIYPRVRMAVEEDAEVFPAVGEA